MASLGVAVALAAAHALWALFQWTQLVVARRGGESFCGLGDSESCAAVWDAPFSSAVQAWTVLPVAAWGLAWSLVAFGLPLVALVRRARGTGAAELLAGASLTALAGVASVLVLAGVSLRSGALCTTCAATYVLVLAYAGVVLWHTGKLRGPTTLRGAAWAGGVLALAFLVLLIPARRTPESSAATRATLRRDLGATGTLPENTRLVELVSSLSPPRAQILSDALALYAASPARPLRAPRALDGQSGAAVRITEFTDVLCSHCANLHQTIEELKEVAPAGAFALEERQFPLDATCNPHVPRASEDQTSCLAARARICLEGRPGAFAFASALFREQSRLGPQRIYELAAPFLPRSALEACVAAAETERKLREDIAWALELGIQGTPLVLVNGRSAPVLPEFLYAIVLAEGNADHPAFARLPSPRLRAGLR